VGPGEPGSADEAMSWFQAEHAVLVAAVQLAADAGHGGHAGRPAGVLGPSLIPPRGWADNARAQHAALTPPRHARPPAGGGPRPARPRAWPRPVRPLPRRLPALPVRPAAVRGDRRPGWPGEDSRQPRLAFRTGAASRGLPRPRPACPRAFPGGRAPGGPGD